MRTNDRIRFARLSAELDAAGASTSEVIDGLTASMDHVSGEVTELENQAGLVWETEIDSVGRGSALLDGGLGPR
ncbi:hypothetical protein [Nocardia nova]|uniref:hypothetical protein n=1 Tax=Nocardia nova TaxID=37330 RepID=UPI0033FB49B1